MANSEPTLTESWQDVTGVFSGKIFNVESRGANAKIYISDGETPTEEKGISLLDGIPTVVQLDAGQQLFARAYRGTCVLVMNG